MLFYTDSASLILRPQLLTDANAPITAIAFGDVDLAVSYLLEGAAAWVTPALVAGTLGTYLANSWVEIGQGIYQYCPPDAVIVAGKRTMLRMVYGANKPQFDFIEAVLLANGSVSVSVLPLTGELLTREFSETIPLYVGEQLTVAVGAVDSAGAAVDLTGRSLRLVAETDRRVNVLDVVPTIDGSTFSFAATVALTSVPRTLTWALWDTAAESIIMGGPMPITYKPQRPAA